MVSKSQLQAIISKYNLSGMIDAVKWVVNDNQLTIDFDSPSKDMIGKITHTKFDLENSIFAVYNTSQLDKLLSITSGDLNLRLENMNGKVFTKLIIEDSNYTLNYPLSELLLIQKPSTVNDPNNYVIESTLDSEAISAVIKAKNALQSDNVVFTTTQNFDGELVVTMVFGDPGHQSNKIEYIVPNTVITGEHYDFVVPFNSEMIRVIFANNRDADIAHMSLNLQGLLKLVFEGDNWKSTYYLTRTVRKQN